MRGEPLHFVSQIQDVTVQHQSSQQLRESEQRTRVTLDAVADMVLTLDLQGLIQYANAAATRALAGEGAAPLTGGQIQDVMELTTEYAPRSPLDIAVLLDPESNAVDLHSDLLLVQDEASVWRSVGGHARRTFKITARTNLWQHLKPLAKLLRSKQPLHYTLQGELATGLLIHRDLHISRSGEIIPGDHIPE